MNRRTSHFCVIVLTVNFLCFSCKFGKALTFGSEEVTQIDAQQTKDNAHMRVYLA